MYKSSLFSAPAYLLTAVLITALTGCGPSDKTRALQSTAGVIVQTYDDLAIQSRILSSKADELCAEPNEAGLAEIQAQWKTTMDAWMRTQPVGFGPVRELDLGFKMQFWPDPRDMVGSQTLSQIKQVQSDTDAATMKAKIAKATVAVQGLPAVEALVFVDDESANDSGGGDASNSSALATFKSPARCQVLQAITANLEDNTALLAAAWSDSSKDQSGPHSHRGYAKQLTHFNKDNTEYADADAVLSVILGSMLQTLESVTGSKLGWPLGLRADGVPQPFRVESRRSLHSLANIQANIDGMHSIFTAGDNYGIEDYIRALEEGDVVADAVLGKFKQVREQAADLPPLFPTLQAKGDLKGYQTLLQSISELKELFGEDVADKLGVSGGLNFNDGD